MKEQFLNYSQSLALKELGFDEPCLGYYTIYSDGEVKLFTSDKGFRNLEAPLKQQAFKFFREKYDLQYWINDGGMLGRAFIKITGYNHDKFYFSSSEPMEYEEAERESINKLIDIVRTRVSFFDEPKPQ